MLLNNKQQQNTVLIAGTSVKRLHQINNGNNVKHTAAVITKIIFKISLHDQTFTLGFH